MLKLKFQLPNKLETKKFIKYAVPIVLQSMIFTFNGVLDNFMVGDVPGATGALRAVNAVTGIALGGIYAIIGGGAIVASQYLTGGNKDQYNQTIRFRLLAGMMIVIIMVILWFTFSDFFINSLSHADKKTEIGKNIIYQSHRYGIWRSVSWFIIPFSATYTAGLREIGKGKITLYSSILGLGLNFGFNILFINKLNMGAAGAGAATVIARASNMIFLMGYCYWFKNEVAIPIKKYFSIDREIVIQMFKRWPAVLLFFLGGITIIYRDFFYTQAYPPKGPMLEDGAVTVLSLTGSIYNVFLGMFAATSSTVNIFVGRQLGVNNLKVAEENAGKLKILNSGFALFLSLVLLAISFEVPYMHFLLTNNSSKNPHQSLVQVQHSLWVICLFYPYWIWFTTSYYSILSGGNTLKAALIDFTTSGFGLIWLVVMNATGMQNKMEFWLYYGIFFLSDIVKGIAMTIAFHKIDWAKNIVQEGLKYRKKEA